MSDLYFVYAPERITIGDTLKAVRASKQNSAAKFESIIEILSKMLWSDEIHDFIPKDEALEYICQMSPGQLMEAVDKFKKNVEEYEWLSNNLNNIRG